MKQAALLWGPYPGGGFRPDRAEEICFLLFCVDKREESNKEEKNNQGRDFDLPSPGSHL